MGRSSAISAILFASVAMLLALAVQSCDIIEGYLPGGEAVTWRQYNEKSVAAGSVTFDCSFIARNAWSVRNENPSMLTIKSATNGPKGRNTLTIFVSENKSGAERTGGIVIEVEGYEEEVLLTVVQSDSNPGGGSETPAEKGGDYDVNSTKIDPALSQYYLWNDEYNSLTRNYNQTFSAFVETTLLSMKTNIEDGGYDSSNKRKLYTYIYRSASSRSVLEKSSEPTFGVVNVVLVSFYGSNGQPTGEYALCLSGIYPDSPADKAGLHRGTWVLKADGAALTATNVNSVFARLVSSPTAGSSIKLTVVDEYTATAQQRDVTLTAAVMPLNPVLHAEVKTVGTSKVGYLVYSDFEASFDDELLAELRKFRDSKVDELVLDLRINGGGHVISMQMLTSIIAGAAGEGKVCMKHEYNPTRMKAYGYSMPDNTYTVKFGPYAGGSNYSKSDYISLPRLWVLVSGQTASASEMTVTSLRGIGFPVTLIGERTEGKNVGMEPQDFTYGGYYYTFYPITFRLYNAMNQTTDPDGIVPDYEVNEWSAGNSSYWAWGSANDPMLSKALSLITGTRAEAGEAVPAAANSVVVRKMRRPGGGMIAPLLELPEKEE